MKKLTSKSHGRKAVEIPVSMVTVPAPKVKRVRKTQGDITATQVVDAEKARAGQVEEAVTDAVEVVIPATEATAPAAPAAKPAKAAQAPKPPKVEAPKLSQAEIFALRAASTRRTRAGKFTGPVFVQIGGSDCPDYQGLTWAERDALHLTNTAVRARYEAHMASIAAPASAAPVQK